MPIPNFDENGFLPEGVYDATESELFEQFRIFRETTRRLDLSRLLKEYLGEIRERIPEAEVYVDGSFVTTKPIPSDIDLVLSLPETVIFNQEDLSPYTANLISASRVRRAYGFDILVAPRGSILQDDYLDDFQDVKGRPGLRKGIDYAAFTSANFLYEFALDSLLTNTPQ
ncbi:DUF6932 family protein [Candidatus Binatus sp.]|uniref:DUF6932 family protein n=1 Tax=Candidatus Binatus sp. TaxID=2811406 RepID=UPI003CC579CA